MLTVPNDSTNKNKSIAGKVAFGIFFEVCSRLVATGVFFVWCSTLL